MDWIANNIYWTDYDLAVIMVLDLDTLSSKTLMKTGPNTVPGDIAVDPNSR